MNRLIERAKGSKATIYALFGNKERLFAAVVEYIIEGTEDFVTADEIAGSTLRDGLIAIGARLIETATSPRHLALSRLVIAESPRFPALGRIYHQRTSARFTQLIAEFIAAHSSGVTYLRPVELAEMYTGMLLHHLLFEHFCEEASSPTPARLRRLTAQAAEFIASAVATSPERNQVRG